MLSSMQLFSLWSIILVIISLHFTNGIPINSEESEETNTPIDEQNNFLDESRLFKRKLPVEGILIGRRSFPNQGIMLGKRDYPTEGILLGKRYYPTEGIILGKRNLRLFAPKTMGYN